MTGVWLEVWRTANIILAAWCASWILIVAGYRKTSHDPYFGQIISIGMIFLMGAVIIGSATNIYQHRAFTLSLPLTTTGLFLIAIARHKAIVQRSKKPTDFYADLEKLGSDSGEQS